MIIINPVMFYIINYFSLYLRKIVLTILPKQFFFPVQLDSVESMLLGSDVLKVLILVGMKGINTYQLL